MTHIRNRKQINAVFPRYPWWLKFQVFLERNRPIKVSLSVRLKDLLGPVTRVNKKKRRGVKAAHADVPGDAS